MMEHEFKAVFLTDAGTQRQEMGESTKDDQWSEIKSCTIDLDSIESYYESNRRQFGKTICNVRTKSGDEWMIAIEYAEMKAIKKGLFAIKGN